MDGGDGGDQDGLALDGLGRAVNFGELLVEAFNFKNGAVSADVDVVGDRFVVTQPNLVSAVAQGADHLGHAARGAQDPLLGRQGFHLGHAGVKEEQLQVQTFMNIPALLLGQPGQEGFKFRHPAGLQLHRGLGLSRRQGKNQNSGQNQHSE